jgi:hypothetical protein
MYWVKRKIQQIKRVIDFFPLIWNGFDFDYRYALDLFKKQLERQVKFMESDRAMTLEAKNNAKKIRTAIRLMDKVYDEEYSTEYMNTIDKLYGTTHYDFEELEEKDKNGDPYYRLVHWNEKAVDDKHQKEIDEVRHEMMLLSQDKQKRAHKLLWSYIEHNIQRWWD